MTIDRVGLLSLGNAARKDMLEAMDLLPMKAPLAKVVGVPLVVAQHYSAAQHVLVSDVDSYQKPGLIRKIIEDGLGTNLFTAEGDAWLLRRQTIAPVFAMRNVEAIADTIAGTVSETLDSWQAGELDIQDAMTDLTVRIALRSLLGTGEETASLAADVRREFEEILGWVAFRFNQPTSLPAVIPISRNRRLKASKTKMQAAIQELIEHRRRHDAGSVDVLSQLVRAQGNEPESLPDEAIVDECIGFMFAGHETTAATLTWALYELSLRPELQADVAAEGALLRTAGSGQLFEAIQSMERISGVVEESLRLYPAGISIARTAKRTTELEGRKIRRGTMVMIPVYAIQRSPLVWDAPDDFIPTRDHKETRGGFLSFGLGPRRCLGARFARTELHIALGLICAAWELRYTSDAPPKPIVAPSLQAEGGLALQIGQRS